MIGYLKVLNHLSEGLYRFNIRIVVAKLFIFWVESPLQSFKIVTHVFPDRRSVNNNWMITIEIFK